MLEVLERPEARQMLHKIAVSEYFELAEGLKTELIRGIIFDKMPKSPMHVNFLLLLTKILRKALADRFDVMSENPLAFADSAPEPDIAIIDPVTSLAAPRLSSAHLVVEISVTTQAYDAAKSELYAEANIPQYWQILPLEKKTVVSRIPIQGKYSRVDTVPFETALTATLPGFDISVLLSEIK